ncbi:hypothetical protein [Pseudomonas sp. St316]|uniref:hypothetical protein n=1 Tax=Pseudomonas sp. St316 TaxID=2678257 RepID=UPI001BB40C27|nr:hypothetical protein [Pseudomonas sp. St316]BBP60378.1 hypothetical protein PHLH4_39680 [Pseudomonas sp. St316]
MTTLEEISQCPKANRQFWSDRARSSLAFCRYNGAGPADRRLERAAFRKNMTHRRAQTYLDVPRGQLDMFGEAA